MLSCVHIAGNGHRWKLSSGWQGTSLPVSKVNIMKDNSPLASQSMVPWWAYGLSLLLQGMLSNQFPYLFSRSVYSLFSEQTSSNTFMPGTETWIITVQCSCHRTPLPLHLFGQVCYLWFSVSYCVAICGIVRSRTPWKAKDLHPVLWNNTSTALFMQQFNITIGCNILSSFFRLRERRIVGLLSCVLEYVGGSYMSWDWLSSCSLGTIAFWCGLQYSQSYTVQWLSVHLLVIEQHHE